MPAWSLLGALCMKKPQPRETRPCWEVGSSLQPPHIVVAPKKQDRVYSSMMSCSRRFRITGRELERDRLAMAFSMVCCIDRCLVFLGICMSTSASGFSVDAFGLLQPTDVGVAGPSYLLCVHGSARRGTRESLHSMLVRAALDFASPT